MIGLSELEQYFPNLNRPIVEGAYTFLVSLHQGDGVFAINLKIRQEDRKEDHLVKLRVGLGKDRQTGSMTHDPSKPHFEIDLYRRENNSFSVTAYFTLSNATDTELQRYAKGTVHLISGIIEQFFDRHQLDRHRVQAIVYSDQVKAELEEYEPFLIQALYDCYKHSDLVVRDGMDAVVVKTEHTIRRYLNLPDLRLIYLPLLKKIHEQLPAR